ncbi:MAG TPA: hypothetical protein VER98_15185, partial [Terriglobia bacterium]|nr:hypothetical protein [Terriglobia bacterium]
RVAGLFFYFADRTNRVVRVGLFFDGDPIAGSLVLAQAKAEGGGELGDGRWEQRTEDKVRIPPLSTSDVTRL